MTPATTRILPTPLRRLARDVALRRLLPLSVALAFLVPASVRAETPTLDAEEQAFLTEINTYRQRNGLAPLKLSPTLTAAAKWMSADMAAKNYFNHTDSLGRDAFSRSKAFGYTYSTYWGENIAAGNASAANTMVQWKNSPGHNANMLNASYKVIGIGRAYGAASTYRWYWTTDFGGYDDSAAPTPTPTPTKPVAAAPVGPAPATPPPLEAPP